MKKAFLFVFLVFASVLCFAQDEIPSVVPERPGYTWGAEVTPLHKIIWDQGIGYESTPEGINTLTLSSTVLRYGLFENMELRFGTDFLMYNKGEAIAPFTGLSPLTIGTKIKLYEGSGILPSVGILAEVQSPHIGSKDLLPSHLAPSMYLIFENIITDWLSVCYNAGEQWDGESAKPTTFLGLALNFSINDQLGAFIDSYNYLNSEEGNQYMLETGLYWQVSHRVQLDIEGDFDLQNLGKYYSVGCGMSWMIN